MKSENQKTKEPANHELTKNAARMASVCVWACYIIKMNTEYKNVLQFKYQQPTSNKRKLTSPEAKALLGIKSSG